MSCFLGLLKHVDDVLLDEFLYGVIAAYVVEAELGISNFEDLGALDHLRLEFFHYVRVKVLGSVIGLQEYALNLVEIQPRQGHLGALDLGAVKVDSQFAGSPLDDLAALILTGRFDGHDDNKLPGELIHDLRGVGSEHHDG